MCAWAGVTVHVLFTKVLESIMALAPTRKIAPPFTYRRAQVVRKSSTVSKGGLGAGPACKNIP